MANLHSLPTTVRVTHSLYRALAAFPIACFSLTVLTDIAYLQTSNLLWLHFSEWLLLAGLVFGALAAVVAVLDYLIGRVRPRPHWPVVIGFVVVFLLAVLNSFIHTADGWTAVVPYGMTVSVLTVIAMLATGLAAGWFGRTGERYV